LLRPPARPVIARDHAFDGNGPELERQDGQRPQARSTLSPAELGRLVRATAAAADDWREIVRFTEDSRWFHRLALAADCEIWLLSWLPGQHTGFHDHGLASGAFTVACGNLVETLARPESSQLQRRIAAQGSVTTFGRRHLHDVSCGSAEPAISVHAYSPPLSAMRQYQMTAAGLELVGTEQAEQDW
jgi:predicted metal-dependent enzyme (double-stranded beta helix superfamily)